MIRRDNVAGLVTVKTVDTKGFANTVTAGSHTLAADEPTSVGGGGTGPNPYEFLLAALGT